MKVLICPDSFKGSASSISLVEAIADELAALDVASPGDIRRMPISDGGEGFIDAVSTAIPDCTVHTASVMGPHPDMKVDAAYAVRMEGETIAFVEMAQAAGLELCDPTKLDPMNATTYGVGQLIRHIVETLAPTTIIMGLGGSATNDCGVGFLQALGATVAVNGVPLTRAATVSDVLSGATITALPTVGCPIHAVCDVTSPLIGPTGAAYVYGPQKGVPQAMLAPLDAAIGHVGRSLRPDSTLLTAPGAGAAGGLGAAVLSLGGRMIPGSEAVDSLLGLPGLVAGVDLVITGEGRYDSQTANGKVISAVQATCRAAGVRCLVLCGSCDPDLSGPDVVALTERYPLEECMGNTIQCVKGTIGAVLDQR